MDLNRKIAFAKTAVDSISRHEDEDAAVRHAALDILQSHIAEERKAIDARVEARIKASLAAGVPAAA